jgi:hypothetical protein
VVNRQQNHSSFARPFWEDFGTIADSNASSARVCTAAEITAGCRRESESAAFFSKVWGFKRNLAEKSVVWRPGKAVKNKVSGGGLLQGQSGLSGNGKWNGNGMEWQAENGMERGLLENGSLKLAC